MPANGPNQPDPNINLPGMDGMALARNMYHFHRNAPADTNIKYRINLLKLQSQRALMPTLLAYYTGQLSETNEACFRFMNRQQKLRLMNRLVYTCYLLNSQYQLDEMESRGQALPGLTQQMARCNELLDRLGVSPDKESPGSLLLDDSIASEKPLKFSSMREFAPSFAKTMFSFCSSVLEDSRKHMTGTAIGAMSSVNSVRLYWVWGGSMLSSLLSVLPGVLHNSTQAQQRLSAPSKTTGYMSWILYYARFGINLSLLLKHSIKGPWMSKEESQIPWTQRFKTQWEQRKFTLLNDAIWATANLACFYWLKGSGLMGYGGNVVTAGLLLMDLCLTCWRFWEESTAHNKKMQEIAQAHAALKASIASLRAGDKPDNEAIAALEQQRDDLKKLYDSTEFEWKYKRWGMENDLFYAGSLLIAFALMCCFFFPPALMPAATVAVIGLAGAALCFLLTVAYAAINGGLEMSKSRELGNKANHEGQDLLDQFHNTDNLDTRKRLYLEMQAVSAKSVYHQQMARFQALNLVRSVLIDALIPALVFASIALMPLGAGLGVLGAALVLILISKIVMNQLEPGMTELPEMNDEEEQAFDEFNAHTPRLFPIKHADHVGFFNPQTPMAVSEETPLLGALHENGDDSEWDMDDAARPSGG